MRTSATFLAAALLSTGALVHPLPAYADDPELTITTTGTVDWWQTITSTVAWCPGAADAGEQLVVALPGELTGFKPGAAVKDYPGASLATATVSDRTLTLRLDEPLDAGACATVHLESVLAAGRSAAGTDLDLRFMAGDEEVRNDLHVRAWTRKNRREANAWGEFRDPHDQCRTDGDNCIVWHWDTPEGPLPNGVVRGQPASGQQFSCDGIQVLLAQLGEHDEVVTNADWTGRVSCTPDELRVDLGDVPAGAMARVNAPVSVRPVANGGVTYLSEFVASGATGTSIAKDTLTSTTASLAMEAGPEETDDPSPDQRQGIWPFLTIGGLLVAAVLAVLVRRRRARS